MEFRRAQRVEMPDEGLVAEHWRRITPLLHRRGLFSGARDFRLYDCWTDGGGVNEDVFAYSNRDGDERALVLFHNRWADARGWIRTSVSFAEKRSDGTRPLRQATLAESLGLDARRAPHVRCRDVVSGFEFLFRTRELADRGLRVELPGYGSRVLIGWREVPEDGRPWGELCNALQGGGTASLDERMLEHELAPVQHALAAVADALGLDAARDAPPAGALPARSATNEAAIARGLRAAFEQRVRAFLERARAFAHGASSASAGLPAGGAWTGDEALALAAAGDAFEALLRLPALPAARRWAKDAEAAAALPLEPLEVAAAERRHATTWCIAVTWLAARALGPAAVRGGGDADAARLFDAMRLRRGVFEALAFRGLGWSEEDRWRAAALVRAALAHAGWRAAGPADAPPPWRDDHDVRWLIGAHEADGVAWFRREEHARFVWWRALPALLDVAAKDSTAVAGAEAAEWAGHELRRAQSAHWRLDELLGNAPAAPESAAPRAS